MTDTWKKQQIIYCNHYNVPHQMMGLESLKIHCIMLGKITLTKWNNLLIYYQSFFFYSPTDAQVNCLKNNFKIYIKINIKTAPTCFGAVTPSSGSALLVLAKVTVVKIAN